MNEISRWAVSIIIGFSAMFLAAMAYIKIRDCCRAIRVLQAQRRDLKLAENLRKRLEALEEHTQKFMQANGTDHRYTYTKLNDKIKAIEKVILRNVEAKVLEKNEDFKKPNSEGEGGRWSKCRGCGEMFLRGHLNQFYHSPECRYESSKVKRKLYQRKWRAKVSAKRKGAH
jgi:hypothetical protein